MIHQGFVKCNKGPKLMSRMVHKPLEYELGTIDIRFLVINNKRDYVNMLS